MGAPRWAQKPDENHPEIVKGLRQMGCTVFEAHRVGSKLPDLIVGYRNLTMLLEVKTPKGRLRKGQEEWLSEWRGHTCIVRSLDEAIAEVMAHVKAHAIR